MTTTTTHRFLPNHEPSWWLRAQVDNMLAGWETNGVHACPHVKRSRRRPAVGVTALYLPQVLTCPERPCANAFKLDGRADFQCDRCHEVFDGIAGVVYDIHVDGLRLLVMLGLCAACEAREVSR